MFDKVSKFLKRVVDGDEAVPLAVDEARRGRVGVKGRRARKAAYAKEYYKEYYKRPEVRARHLARMREYSRRPEVRARMAEYLKEYNKRPYVRAKIRKYRLEYYKRPHVKAKRQVYMRLRRGARVAKV